MLFLCHITGLYEITLMELRQLLQFGHNLLLHLLHKYGNTFILCNFQSLQDVIVSCRQMRLVMNIIGFEMGDIMTVASSSCRYSAIQRDVPFVFCNAYYGD